MDLVEHSDHSVVKVVGLDPAASSRAALIWRSLTVDRAAEAAPLRYFLCPSAAAVFPKRKSKVWHSLNDSRVDLGGNHMLGSVDSPGGALLLCKV